MQVPYDGVSSSDIGHEEPKNVKYRKKACRDFPLGRCRLGDRFSPIFTPNVAMCREASPVLNPKITFTRPSSAAQEEYRRENSSSACSLFLTSRVNDLPIDSHLDGEPSSGLAELNYPSPPPDTPGSFGIFSDTSSVVQSPASPSSFSASNGAEHIPVSVKGPLSRKRSQNVYRRGIHYKTKPCKFFHSNGSCVKGDRCNL